MAQQFEPQQPMEGTLPQSRMDIELSAIGGWHETSQLRNEAQKLALAIPLPPTHRDVILALSAVSDFLTLTADIADPDKGAAKGVAVASLAARNVLFAALQQEGLQQAPAAAKMYSTTRSPEAYACLEKLQPPPAAPGEHEMPLPEDTSSGAGLILLHLASVQLFASSMVSKSVKELPFVACSLTEDMLKDRQEHALFFTAAARLNEVYTHLFDGKRADYKVLWADHINVVGRISHPARVGQEQPAFDHAIWVESLYASKEMLARGAAAEHPLPDAKSLRFCFKTIGDNKGPKKGPSDKQDRCADMFFLDKDTVCGVALLCGDLVYRLVLHMDEVLPQLAPGRNRPIPHRHLSERVLLLGLFFQVAINYQTYSLGSVYKLFDVADIHYSLSFPVNDSPDYKKLVTFICAHKNLGKKRLAAIPYLISAHGLRNYAAFLADPDAYLGKLRNAAALFFDQVTGVITEARARLAMRAQNTPSSPSFSGATPEPSGQQAVSCVSICILIKIVNEGSKKTLFGKTS